MLNIFFVVALELIIYLDDFITRAIHAKYI